MSKRTEADMAAAGSGKRWRVPAVVLAGAFAVGLAVFAFIFLGEPSGGSQLERVFDQVRHMPLVGVVLAENPGLEAQVRQAIKDEIANPTRSGPSRVFLLGAHLRQQYIVPALRDSDDAPALDSVKNMEALVLHLQASDVAACREFGAVGLTRPDKLDPEGAAIFKHALAAQEDAYRSGKAAAQKRDAPDNQQIKGLLAEAGYQQDDFQHLANYRDLSASEACAAMVKIYAAPAVLPPERGAIVARYLLTVSQ